VRHDPASDATSFVIVGRIRRPHGVRGDTQVELHTDSPDAVLAPGRTVMVGTTRGDVASNSVEARVSSTAPFKGGLLVHFDGIETLEAAERWRDRYLLVPRKDLREPGLDEIYVHELVGLTVEGPNAAPLGRVDAFYDLPQGLMLEIRRGERTYILPYREQFVRQLDRERRTLIVELPEGFLE
jgi:16S rRNA processing protein RimM